MNANNICVADGMTMGSSSTTNTQSREISISSTFQVSDLLDAASIDQQNLIDVEELTFSDFEHASVVTGQLLEGANSEYLGFAPAENGFLQWNIEDGIDTEWSDVQQGNSIQIGDSSSYWNYDIVDSVNTKQLSFDGEDTRKGEADNLSPLNDLKFRFSPSAEGKTIADSEYFETNENSADLFGFNLSSSQSIADDLKDIALTINTSSAQSYGVGQAVGISETEVDVGGSLNVYSPVDGAVSSAASGVTNNSVAITEGTSFGGIFGNNIEAPESENITFNAASDLNAVVTVSSDLSSFADTKSDLPEVLVDADAHTRVGIKLPMDGGEGLLLNPANGGFGIANMDMIGGGDVQMSADVRLGADAGAMSTEGRARAIVEVSKVSGLEDSAALSGDDLDIRGVSGADLNSISYSDRGTAEAKTSMDSSIGIHGSSNGEGDLMNSDTDSDPKTETPYEAGGSLSVSTGSQLKASTHSAIIGNGEVDAFEIADESSDEAISETVLGDAFGLYSDKDMGLKMKAADSMDLEIQSDVDIETTAQAVLGNAKSSGEITQNNGSYNADLQAGSSGFIDADSSTQIMTTAQTVVGDTEAFGTALNTAAIGSSIFSFPGLEAEIDAAAVSIGESQAISTAGVAESTLRLSTMGINGVTDGAYSATVDGARLINAVASSSGFTESAAVSGSASQDLVSAGTNQAALGLTDYEVTTGDSLEMTSIVEIQSGATSVFGTTTI